MNSNVFTCEEKMERLLTVQEAAYYLNCHQMTVRKMISKRQIPFIRKEGIGIRIRKKDIENWLQEDLKAASEWKESS